MCYSVGLSEDVKPDDGSKFRKNLKEAFKRLNFEFQEQINGFDNPELLIIPDDYRTIITAKWGFREDWDTSRINLNTRWENINSDYWRRYKKNRCLVIVNCFYEWQHQGKKKVKHKIRRGDKDFFILAGIYRNYTLIDGSPERQFSILTTEAIGIMRDIHNSKLRMPWVMFDKINWKSYLDGGIPMHPDSDLVAEVV